MAKMSFVAGAVFLLVSQLSWAGTVLKFQNGDVVAPAGFQINKAVGIADVSTDDYVVQFTESITEANKAVLKKAGIRIFRYIPDDALIVRATSEQLSVANAELHFHAVLPFKGTMKLSDNLPTSSVFSRMSASAIIISHFTAADAKETLAYLRSLDSDLLVLDQSTRVLVVRMNQALVPELADRRGVEFVQKAEKIEPLHMVFDENFTTATSGGDRPAGDYTDIDGTETGTKVMSFEAIWSQGFHGKGQIVGMADTGLDMGTVDTVSADFKGAVKNGFSFGIGAKSWDDPMGHGTHVAGSILGRGTSSGGKLKGGAYEALFVPQGMWSPVIDNLTVPPKLNKLFDAALTEGAKIHSNSWGAAANFGAYDAMAVQVDEFMWAHPDFLILFAAGNSGVDKDKDGRIDPNSVGTPGTAKNVLTVGASENVTTKGGIQKLVSELKGAADKWGAEPILSSKISDNAEGLAMFSSRGPTRDGRLKPEIVAPGTNILSARSHVPLADPMWGAYNADYTYAGGTSMATPLTAGAAAITREVLISRFKIAQPSAALVKAVLMHTAHDMFPGQYGAGATQELKVRRPNMDEGYGRVDMAAIAKIQPSTYLLEKSVAQGESFTQTVKVTSGKLLVNLVYTDAPGTPTASQALVNNLDLTVVGADRKVYGSPDAINNNEIVELSNLKAGNYTITVQGTKIPMGLNGKQPFALVVTAL